MTTASSPKFGTPLLFLRDGQTRLLVDEDRKEGLHDSLTALAQCLGRLIAM